jgi:hypothetical protein
MGSRAAAPFVELADGVGAVHVELERRFGLRTRQHLDGQLENQPERSKRTRHQPGYVIARDVLHDLAAERQHLALAVHDDGAEHEVACRARRMTARTSNASRNAAVERGLRAEVRRLESKHLVVFGKHRFDFEERRAGARRDDQFGRIVGDDAAMRARVEDLTLQ